MLPARELGEIAGKVFLQAVSVMADGKGF